MPSNHNSQNYNLYSYCFPFLTLYFQVDSRLSFQVSAVKQTLLGSYSSCMNDQHFIVCIVSQMSKFFFYPNLYKVVLQTFSCLDHTFPVHLFYFLYIRYSAVKRSFLVLLILKNRVFEKKKLCVLKILYGFLKGLT